MLGTTENTAARRHAGNACIVIGNARPAAVRLADTRAVASPVPAVAGGFRVGCFVRAHATAVRAGDEAFAAGGVTGDPGARIRSLAVARAIAGPGAAGLACVLVGVVAIAAVTPGRVTLAGRLTRVVQAGFCGRATGAVQVVDVTPGAAHLVFPLPHFTLGALQGPLAAAAQRITAASTPPNAVPVSPLRKPRRVLPPGRVLVK